MYNIKCACLCTYNRLLERFHRAPSIMSNEETIAQLIENRKSLGRFGDGEMMLIEMVNELSFQKVDKKLSERLDQVLRTTDQDFLVGLPRVFSETDLQERNESSASYWKNNLLYMRNAWYKRISFKQTYASSTFTRNYLTLKDKSFSEQYFNSVKKIWESRKVLIIEGEKSRVGVGNDLFSNTADVKRILCPSTNAFDVYDEILKTSLSVSKDYLILISLGPTATVLAYDLFKNGFQAIDIGHIDVEFEWFLRKSEGKDLIPGKWVAEGGGMQEDSFFEDFSYKKQIMAVINS